MRRWFRNLWKSVKRLFQPPKEYQAPAEPEPPVLNDDGSLPTTGVIEDDFTPEEHKAKVIELFKTIEIKPLRKQKASHVTWYVNQIKKNRLVYVDAANYVSNKLGLKGAARVPWEVVAVLHAMEASFDLDEQILNGQDWDKKTTIVPKGMGPWPTFNDSCVDGFRIKKLPPDWDLGNTLWFCERWNGLGYYKKGKNSPYIFSYSQHQPIGKYVRDHVYDPTAVSLQVGVAVMLKELGYEGQDSPVTV